MAHDIIKGDLFRDAHTGRLFQAIHDGGSYATWVRVLEYPAKPHRVGHAQNLANHWLHTMERVPA